MFVKSQMHPYQTFSVEHAVKHKFCGLFLGMGTGKTVSTLTVINQLMYEEFEVEKVLIIAPKFVAMNVWKDEIEKWAHLRHLSLSIVAGQKNAEARIKALRRPADIYIINRENVSWLVNLYGTSWPFDLVVIDELSSFKDSSAKRFTDLKSVRPRMKRVIGLTGTPAPNGLHDLWSQLYLLDEGKRLGNSITAFREAYLTKKESGFGHRVRAGCEDEIHGLISDICISMKAEDYLSLPPCLYHTVKVHLSPEVQEAYDNFEEDQIMQMVNGTEITALSAGVLFNKLLQFSNGAVYDPERNVHLLHDEKLDALEELIEQCGNTPVLLAYNYQHDRDRILKRFPKARILQGEKDIKDWNLGVIPLLICHPASAGHGLNLQKGGYTAIWYGLNPSLELFQQFNKRLDRQGQTKPVNIYKLVAVSTMDERVEEILEEKEEGQNGVLNAVKARIAHYQQVAKIS